VAHRDGAALDAVDISPTPPSCELANTWISTRPLVRSFTSLATSSAYNVCGALATPTCA
jgi:hypothetical protein